YRCVTRPHAIRKRTLLSGLCSNGSESAGFEICLDLSYHPAPPRRMLDATSCSHPRSCTYIGSRPPTGTANRLLPAQPPLGRKTRMPKMTPAVTPAAAKSCFFEEPWPLTASTSWYVTFVLWLLATSVTVKES